MPYLVPNYPCFSTVSISDTDFKLYKHPGRDSAVKDASEEDKHDVNIYPRVLDFFRHFIVPSPHICKDFGYHLSGHRIGVVLPQAKLEHFAESATMTEAYVVGAGYVYGTFHVNSELYSQLPHINKLQINPRLEIIEPTSQLLKFVAANFDPNILPMDQTYIRFRETAKNNPQEFDYIKTVWVCQFYDLPKTDAGPDVTRGQEAVLARIIARSQECETLDHYIMATFRTEVCGDFRMGDLLIPKSYCLKLDGADTAHRKYGFY